MAFETHAERQQSQDKLAPPYVPYQTFEAFLERIKGTVTPTRVDTSVLRHLSGTAQSQLLLALRFLGLVQTDGKVNGPLKRLVAAFKTQNWKAELGTLTRSAYGPIIGDLDITSATPAQLKEKFREGGGVEGDTVDKCIRFYLMALKESGIDFSPLLKIRHRNPRGNAQRRASRRDNSESDTDIDDEDADRNLPTGTVRLPFPLPGKPMTTITLATGITEAEWMMIDTYVRNYIKLTAKEEK